MGVLNSETLVIKMQNLITRVGLAVKLKLVHAILHHSYQSVNLGKDNPTLSPANRMIALAPWISKVRSKCCPVYMFAFKSPLNILNHILICAVKNGVHVFKQRLDLHSIAA